MIIGLLVMLAIFIGYMVFEDITANLEDRSGYWITFDENL